MINLIDGEKLSRGTFRPNELAQEGIYPCFPRPLENPTIAAQLCRFLMCRTCLWSCYRMDSTLRGSLQKKGFAIKFHISKSH